MSDKPDKLINIPKIRTSFDTEGESILNFKRGYSRYLDYIHFLENVKDYSGKTAEELANKVYYGN